MLWNWEGQFLQRGGEGVHVCVHTCLCECILCLWNNTTGHQIIFTCSDQNLWGRTIWKICLNSKLKPSVTATLVSCIPPWYRSLHCLINLEPTFRSRSCDTVPFSWVSSSSVELTRTSPWKCYRSTCETQTPIWSPLVQWILGHNQQEFYNKPSRSDTNPRWFPWCKSEVCTVWLDASGWNEELLQIQCTVNDWKQTRTCSQSKRHIQVVVDTKDWQ